jgi:hypothetical protein
MDIEYFYETLEEGRVKRTRPETKSREDLARVIKLGKSNTVISKFLHMVNEGIKWDWFEKYEKYLEDKEEFDNFIPEEVLNEDGEVEYTTSMEEPIEPILGELLSLNVGELRAAHYPDVTDFADAYVHLQNGSTEQMDDYVAKCLQVKEDFPKS